MHRISHLYCSHPRSRKRGTGYLIGDEFLGAGCHSRPHSCKRAASATAAAAAARTSSCRRLGSSPRGAIACVVAAAALLAFCYATACAAAEPTGDATVQPAHSHPATNPRASSDTSNAPLPHAAQPPAGQRAATAPDIAVVVGPQSPALVRFAARELAQQLARLYGTQVDVTEELSPGARSLVLVGSPENNPAIAAAFGRAWPQLSEQGLLLRSIADPPALVVGGGSPPATLWAAYELGRRLGITYLLSGDVYPPPPTKPFDSQGYDVLLEPQFTNRFFVTLGDRVIGPASWGLEEHARVLRQLAKLKFNGVLLLMHPWQPFVHVSANGTAKTQARLWRQNHWPVAGDTAGRAAFAGAREFFNPDLAGKPTYQDLTAAGIELARGILARARELGMACAVWIAPLELPHDFARLLPDGRAPADGEALSLIPHATDAGQRQTWLAAASAQLRAYLDTYPGLDALYLSLPQEPVWTASAAAAWDRLTHGRLEKLEQYFERLPAEDRGGVQGQLLLGHVSSLAFLRELLASTGVQGGGKPQVYVAGAHAALYPVLDELLPPDAGVMTRFTQVHEPGSQDDLRAGLPGRRNCTVWLQLGEAGGGTFLTSEAARLPSVLQAAAAANCDGFVVQCDVAADHELGLHLLSRASFEPHVTMPEALRELVEPMCGEGVAERVALALDRVEKAGILMARHDPQFGRPSPDMVLRHAVAEPAPQWWEEAATLYSEAANDLYRASDRSRPEGRPYLRRQIRRCEWAWYYFQSLAALRAAEQHAKDDADARVAQLEAAVEHMYNGLAAMAEAAQDNSTRAIIAVLNEYGYRPLAARLDEASR